jgi:hypothetical protein
MRSIVLKNTMTWSQANALAQRSMLRLPTAEEAKQIVINEEYWTSDLVGHGCAVTSKEVQHRRKKLHVVMVGGGG